MPNRTWVKAAHVGLAAGLLMVVAAVVVVVTHPGRDDSPTCDGHPMLETDMCIEHRGDGSTERLSFEQMQGHFDPVGAGLLLGGGTALAAGSVWVRRRNREQPSEFAPFHIIEVAAKD